MSTPNTDKEKILYLINNYDFSDVNHLIEKIEEDYNIPRKKSIKIIIDLEDENKIKITSKKKYIRFSRYLLSSIAARFWVIQIICIIIFLLNFYNPSKILPLMYFRNLLGVIFLLFFPGYSFIDYFIEDEENNKLEKIIFSIGLSLIIVPIIGIILNLTPFGLNPFVIIIILWFQIFIMTIARIYNNFKNQVT